MQATIKYACKSKPILFYGQGMNYEETITEGEGEDCIRYNFLVGNKSSDDCLLYKYKYLSITDGESFCRMMQTSNLTHCPMPPSCLGRGITYRFRILVMDRRSLFFCLPAGLCHTARYII